MSEEPKNWMAGTSKEDMYAKAEAEKEAKALDSHAPTRFGLSYKTGTKYPTSAGIVILNASLNGGGPKDGFAVWEHQVWGPNVGKEQKTFYRASCKEFEDDPLTRLSGKEPALVTYLTVLDLTPYTTAQGKEYAYTRRILPIKYNQLSDYTKIFEVIMKNKGTLRGAYLFMERDTSDSKSPKIGTPTLLENGMLFDHLTEEELEADYGHDAVKNRDGKVIHEANAMLQPFSLTDVYPSKPTAEALRAEFGGDAPLGGQGAEGGQGGSYESSARPRPRPSQSEGGNERVSTRSRRTAKTPDDQEIAEGAAKSDDLPTEAESPFIDDAAQDDIPF